MLKMELRSLEHIEPAYVRFENKTGRSIDVVWVNYSGIFVRYGILEPGEFLDINTFKTHPWIFIDRHTGERMKVTSGKVYYPSSCSEISQRLGLDFEGHFRIPIPIFWPLFSLRQLSLHKILDSIQNITHVEELELPDSLKRDLKDLNRNRQRLMAILNLP